MNPIRLVHRVVAGWMPYGRCHCVMCGGNVWRFLPYRKGSKSRPALMRQLDVIGSDVDRFGCPRCASHDRERHLFMYLDASGLLTEMKDKSIVHFAPERRLSARISAAGAARYVRCDLRPSSPEVIRADLLAMDFESQSVDLLIASHVLEHVADDGRALTEIRRILKLGGHAILQTPFSPVLHCTWEDAGIVDPKARRQAFGQEDHVRLYGRDIFDRFASFGLQPCVQQHSQLLPGIDSRKFGVNEREPFFLFRRVD